MHKHPLNLAIRFLLEMTALVSSGVWAYGLDDSFMGIVYAVLTVILLMILWGVFNVPNDPSRSGKVPMVVKGWLRLLIEFAIFSFGIWTMNQVCEALYSCIFGGLIVLHYLVSYERIIWLLKR